jgi:hypothetical protein
MAKLAFHLVGMDNTGTVVLRKRLARSALRHLIVTLSPLRIGIAAFDMARLRAWREHEVWGNAYRKLRAYQPLTMPAVAPPFVRADARR